MIWQSLVCVSCEGHVNQLRISHPHLIAAATTAATTTSTSTTTSISIKHRGPDTLNQQTNTVEFFEERYKMDRLI